MNIAKILKALSPDACECLDSVIADPTGWVESANTQWVGDLVAAELIEVTETPAGEVGCRTITAAGHAAHELWRNLRRTIAMRFDLDMDYAGEAYRSGWMNSIMVTRDARPWRNEAFRYQVAAKWIANYYDHQNESEFGVEPDVVAREIAEYLSECYQAGELEGQRAYKARESGADEARRDAEDSSRWAAPGRASLTE